ncbi:MAG: pili assembly chaperone [Candidatus Angelobacter sp. Gp1-AA117]|nr:MAG: pili assembly chaperone [Candidatus Angelobacter sp. Gp1-AA117]
MAHKQKGFSLIELLIVVAIILIIASIAIPNLMRSRLRANEAAAISTLRTLHTSQAAYNTSYGELAGFAPTLQSLGPGTPCDLNHACLVDANLGCASEPCVRGGYEFFLTSDSSSSPYTDYAFTATPVIWKSSGNQNFCTAEDGMIRYETSPSGPLSAAVPHNNCMNFALYNGI